MKKVAPVILTLALLSFTTVAAEARHGGGDGWNNGWNGVKTGCRDRDCGRFNGSFFNPALGFRHDNGRHLGWYKHHRGNWWAGRPGGIWRWF